MRICERARCTWDGREDPTSLDEVDTRGGPVEEEGWGWKRTWHGRLVTHTLPPTPLLPRLLLTPSRWRPPPVHMPRRRPTAASPALLLLLLKGVGGGGGGGEGVAAGRVRGTMTERKAASAGDRWNSRPLALSRFRSRSFSLRLRRIYSRARARAHTYTLTYTLACTHIETSGAFSLSLLQTHVYPSRTTPLSLGPLDRLDRRRSVSFKLSDWKRFDTVFGGCFNRSFKQSLWTLSFSLSFSLFFCPLVPFVPFSALRQCAIFVAPLYWKILAHLQLETINNYTERVFNKVY